MRLTTEREAEIRQYTTINHVAFLSCQRELLAEIDSLRAERTWQGMESAPKDGTWFLSIHAGEYEIVRWDVDGFEVQSGGYFMPDDLEGWMPLPAPPSTEASSK